MSVYRDVSIAHTKHPYVYKLHLDTVGSFKNHLENVVLIARHMKNCVSIGSSTWIEMRIFDSINATQCEMHLVINDISSWVLSLSISPCRISWITCYAQQEIQYFIFFILLWVLFNYKMLLSGGSHDSMLLSFFFSKIVFHFLAWVATCYYIKWFKEPGRRATRCAEVDPLLFPKWENIYVKNKKGTSQNGRNALNIKNM